VKHEHILLSEILLQVVRNVKHDIIVKHEQQKLNVHEEHNIVKHELVHVAQYQNDIIQYDALEIINVQDRVNVQQEQHVQDEYRQAV